MDNIYDIARKVTERLYGGDKVKYEIIIDMLYLEQKLGGAARYYSEGILDGYIMGVVEHLEDTFYLEDKEEIEKRHKFVREYANSIPISEYRKFCNCLENENILYVHDIEKLDKNQVKNAFKCAVKHMEQ